jgi:hypothetical protein
MRFAFYLLLSLVLPSLAMAQGGTITGKVMSTDLQSPLANASVFLSNATYGTSTANDGTFTLQNVKPGQYELVVSYVGYDSYKATVMVGAAPVKLNIEMHLKSYGLGEVDITSHKFSKENFAMFLKYFFGNSAYAKQCKILNPKIIDLKYNKFDKILEGHSDDFIIVENRALGYRLKYLLSTFKYDGINEIVTLGGEPLYEDLKGNKKQIALWHKNREDAYYGSSMHFYRSLMNNELAMQGFVMYRLVRLPNHERPPQYVIVKKMDQFEAERNRDSLMRWQDFYRMRKYNESLAKEPLARNEVFFDTDVPGVYGISFTDCLYVVYTKKHDEVVDNELYRPLDMENFMTSIVTLYTPYAVFDSNGIIMSQKSTLYEGDWARHKIPELLPVDYVPDDKK